jgi:hypothetical protein
MNYSGNESTITLLLGHPTTMLWTHMNDMKLFGSNRYGVIWLETELILAQVV